MDFGVDSIGRILARRFTLKQLLKSGEGIFTFLASDQVEEQDMVLKIAPLSRVLPAARMRLEYEAQILKQALNPSLLPIRFLGTEGESLIVATPFVEGITLARRLAERGPLGLSETTWLARSLLTALAEAHDFKVIHRNIIPSNVIVNDGTPIHQCKLIDFGDSLVRSHTMDSVSFMSPEQAGLLDRDLDERSDLYSLGVLLFSCLSGRPPFAGKNIGEVLRQHLTAPIPELAGFGIQVPKAFEALIRRLLQKDPRDRYQSVEAVLADLKEIRKALHKGISEPNLVIGLRDRRPHLIEPAFVGRTREIELLHLEIARAKEGRGRVVLIRAGSGIGKTRLLAEVARSAQAEVRIGGGSTELGGTPDRPVVVIFDEASRTDRQILAQLEECRKGSSGRYHVVIVAFQPEEFPDDHPAVGEQAVAVISLAPLKEEEIRALAQSMAGSLPEEALGIISQLADGNPFMASSVLRGLVESGALASEPTGWKLDGRMTVDVQSSRQAAAFLVKRLELLPEQSRAVLTIGAVLGRDFELEPVSILTGRDAETVLLALDDARRRQIIWFDARRERYRFVHEQLRTALLSGLSIHERRDLHRAAADFFEKTNRERVFELAYHLSEAADFDRALPFALAAAEEATSFSSLEKAETFFRIASRGVSDQDPELQTRIAEGLGDVLILRGKHQDAEQSLLLAKERACDKDTRARLEAKLGEFLLKQGKVDRAREAILGGLALGSAKLPIVARLLHLQARVSWAERRSLEGLGWHLREWLFLQKNRRSLSRQLADLNHAEWLASLGILSRALRFARRALEVARAVHDFAEEARCLVALSSIQATSGAFSEALDSANVALSLLERTGDRWDRLAALRQRALCHYRLGNLKTAIEIARSTHAEAVRLGDTRNMAQTLEIWAMASGGTGNADESSPLPTAVRLLFSGEPAEAILVLSKDKGETSTALCWLATAHRQLAERKSILDPAGRRQTLRHGKVIARRAVRRGRRFPCDLPHALRELSILEAMSGRSSAALRLLDESIAVASRQNASYERALSLLARGQIASALGDRDGVADVEKARVRLKVLDAPVPRSSSPSGDREQGSLALADRFRTVLEAGRKVALGLTPNVIYAATREAALTLLRAEQCLILKVKPGQDLWAFSVVEGPESWRYSEALAIEAVDTLHPAVHADPHEAELLDFRSALCAPILARGRPVACVYLVHSRVASLFGEEEERLIEFIATIAGAALENAEGFSEMQALSVLLEKRVEERTRDLESSLRQLKATQQQLVQAGKMSALGEMASGVAHEINNPLAIIHGLASQLTDMFADDRVDQERARKLASKIEATSLRIARIIKALRAFSREGGDDPFKPTSIFKIIEETLELCGQRIRSHGVTIEMEAIPSDWMVDCRSTQIEQVLLNLLNNADDAMEALPDKWIRIGVREAAGLIEIRVTDAGTGLSEEARSKIFQPFYTTKEVGKGTGLGLSISKGIIENHGGTLTLDSSSPNTTFVIRLPQRSEATARRSG